MNIPIIIEHRLSESVLGTMPEPIRVIIEFHLCYLQRAKHKAHLKQEWLP